MTAIAEADAMRRAIALSALGLGSTSPNPPVGCVILDREGTRIGEGYHRRKGEAHAEAHALAAAGTSAAGGIAVVTLEPCNHHGTTPPCHQAIIDAGIARVLIAVIDPTSRGDGGTARLRESGIDVEVGLLADEALVVLGPWLAALESARPRVSWAYEMGPDGPRALPDDTLREAGLRAGVDAVIRTDGRIAEGVPGAHGPSAFTLPEVVTVDEPAATLSSLYACGVRSLLVNGGVARAAPFVEHNLVDQVSVVAGPSGHAGPGATDPFLPAGFAIRSVRRLTSAVLIDATPTGPVGPLAGIGESER